MNEICHTGDVSGDPDYEPSGPQLQATTEPTSDRMQFHVQMDRYTQEAMEDLIVEAAARILVGKSDSSKLARDIEGRCASQIMAKLDAKLETVTADIINQPVTSTGFGSNPVTMGEMIGLMGKDYLSEPVNTQGNPRGVDTSWSFSSFGTRAQWLVWNAMETKFKSEIAAATNAAIAQVQTEVRSAHLAMINEEKARLREAMQKLVEPEKNSR
jgi:hypothetical protein